MKQQSTMRLLTIGEICRLHDAPLHRVRYAIELLGVQPVGRAGRFRIFSPEAVEQIGRELARTKEAAHAS